jgi:Ca2+-binding EF-hand superfamily protein
VSPTAQHKSSFASVVSFLGKGLAITSICSALAGCNRGPTPIEVPDYDPNGSAARAMEIYDENSDGFIDGGELEKAPGLKAAVRNFDTDKDERISTEEIAARVTVWQKMAVGLTQLSCEITLDGAPLDGATVTFEPEEFLDGVIQEASGVSRLGSSSPIIPLEKRPSPDTPAGIQMGLYKVKVSKLQGGQETVPSRYNTETILGQEVSPDDRAFASNRIIFTLRSK